MGAVVLCLLVLLIGGPVQAVGQSNEPTRSQGRAYVTQHWTVEEGLPVNTLNDVIQSKRGYLWLATYDGLVRFDGVRFTVFVTTNSEGLPSNRITALSEAPGGLRVRTSHGHLVQRTAAGTFQVRDSTGGKWQGPYLHVPNASPWSVRGGRLYRDSTLLFEAPSPIRAVERDREGSLWIATERDGLYRIKHVLFTSYDLSPGPSRGNVYPIVEGSEGTLWFGTLEDGLKRLRDGRLATYSVGTNHVRALHQDENGTLWVGTKGLCRFVGGTCTPVGPPGLSQRRVYAIHRDRREVLWVGTHDGLYRRADGAWRRFTTADGLSSNWVRAIREAPRGALWLATNGGGLVRYRKGHFTSLTTQDGLSSNRVRSIHQEARDTLWVGTEDKGLNRVVLRGDSLAHAEVAVIRERDGLLDNVIHRILKDDHGRLWMSTNRGVFWVRRAALDAFLRGASPTIRPVSYDERNGMPSRECNGGVQSAGIKASDGRLWFPTQKGAAVIDPDSLRHDGAPPPVVIEQVIVGDTALSARRPVRLAADQRDFAVRYTGLSLRNPEDVHFRYRLEDFHDEWVRAETRRRASFTNIPPGEYTLRVAAGNQTAGWNEKTATVAVTIAPYFYETRWFFGLCLVGVAALVFGGYRWRLRQLRHRQRTLEAQVRTRTEELRTEKKKTERQAARLQEMDKLKSRLFANLSHEFRTPLTLILGPLRDLLDGDRLPEDLRPTHRRMLRNGHRLLRLIDQILDLRRLETGALELDGKTRDLVPFVGRLVQAFQPLAERHRVTLSFDTPDTSFSLSFDPDKLEKVLANLLSNALKFTPEGGAVSVTLQATDTHAEIAVADTGPGISDTEQQHIFDRFHQVDHSATRPQEGTGIGLALTKELVELHGGTIRVDSEVGTGSTFTVQLPVREQEWGEAEPQDEKPGAARDRPLDPALARSDRRRPDPDPRYEQSEREDRPAVLIVDDHPDVRAYVHRILEPTYRVIEAGDGEAGLRKAQEALPDCIVADVMMPRRDGFQMCRALRGDAMTEGIPVILLTARAEAADEAEGLRSGADAYLTKPFDAEVLWTQVGNLIAQRHRLRERIRTEVHDNLDSEEPTSPQPSPFEQELRTAIQAHLSDPDFTVARLAEEVALSRSQLYRRTKRATDQSPNALIRRMRLERAAQLLRDGEGNVSEVAYAVGFESLSYFSRRFREHTGTPPSTLLPDDG